MNVLQKSRLWPSFLPLLLLILLFVGSSTNTIAAAAKSCALRRLPKVPLVDATRHGHRNDSPGRIPNTVYLIRHAEKPLDDNKPGLTKAGRIRAQCIKNIFSPKSGSTHNISYIIAQEPNPGKHMRMIETVAPLANELGIGVDTSCGKWKKKCVARRVRRYFEDFDGQGKAVLISWSHSPIHKIARALGAKDTRRWPCERYDLIWTIQDGEMTSQTLQRCAALHDEGSDDSFGEDDHDYTLRIQGPPSN